MRRDDGLYVLSLYPPRGQGLDMTLDNRLLHIFGKLVRDGAARADWDLNLFLGDKSSEAGEPEAAGARKLN